MPRLHTVTLELEKETFDWLTKQAKARTRTITEALLDIIAVAKKQHDRATDALFYDA